MGVITDQAQALREMVAQSAGVPTVALTKSDINADPRQRTKVAGQALAPAAPPAPSRRARSIAVASGKGGVGKTSIVTNLAISLAERKKRVVVLDADLGTANVDVLCRLNPARNLAHAVAGRCQLQQVLTEAPGGFSLLPGGSGLASLAALSDRGRQQLLDQLAPIEAEADYLIVDTGAGIGPNVLGFASSVDQLMVVTTPEPAAVADAYALIKSVWRRRPRMAIGLLVNMVDDATQARQVYERIDAVCRRFLQRPIDDAGHLVRDAHVSQAVCCRRPFMLAAPRSEAAGCIAQLTGRVERQYDVTFEQSFFRRIAGWLAR